MVRKATEKFRLTVGDISEIMFAIVLFIFFWPIIGSSKVVVETNSTAIALTAIVAELVWLISLIALGWSLL